MAVFQQLVREKMKMKVQNPAQLFNQEQSFSFYENRYEQGYLDEWPIEKKRKIFLVIQSLHLPTKGEALDFGCGNGVLTEVIREALPSWRIYGTDISKKAVDNAKGRFPACTFFEPNDQDFRERKFDFIFTHHVFEHVFNLSQAFNQMENYLKPESAMLHILPCGNEGSYEHTLCLLRKDGIDGEVGNRFFFEDEGHVRRLTTEDVCALCNTKGFELQGEFYSNQHDGAIDWITSSHPKFVLMLTDTSQAVNGEAKRKLRNIRRRLLSITALRLPARIVHIVLSKRKKHLKHYLLLLMGLPFWVWSYPFDKYWKMRANGEWETRKSDRKGSEMCLYFKRR